MRNRTMFALTIAATVIVAACSSSSSSTSAGSDLTGKTWQLTALTEKVPAFQGVVPEADQANYTIEFSRTATTRPRPTATKSRARTRRPRTAA